MNSFKRKLKAFSLVELILAIGIFATISSMLIFLVVDATKTLDNTKTRSRATNLVQEINTALLLLKDQSWQNISTNSQGTPKHLELMDGGYQIVDGESTYQDLTYSFTISEALRNPSGDLIDTGGDVDPHTRVINISILWNDSLGREQSVVQQLYINDWNTYSLIDTFVEDFNLGTHNGTYVENLTDGEVSLEKMLYSDWCNPSLSMNTYNIPGNGVPKSISTYGNTVIMGSGENMSGDPFIKITAIEDPDTNMPTVSDVLVFTTQYKTNDIHLINETAALLATDTNSTEVVILNMNSTITQVGYFDIPINTDANTISSYADIGFVTESNNLRSFDISTFTGSRPQLDSISLGGQANKTVATDIFIDDQYIYLTLAEHDSEFVIYEHTPSLRLVGEISLGDMDARALFISEDKTKAFIGTANNTSDELYIVDITDKETNYTVISSLDLGGMSVNALISIENRIVIGGEGGQEYKVLEADNLNGPTTCGGLSLGISINDMALVQTPTSNYSYILSSNGLLQFIRGGLGGGGPDGNGYLPTGEFISQVFDTTFTASEYYMMILETDMPTNTSLKLQLRASDTSDMSGSTWVGPDGTNTSYYENSNVYNISSDLIGRYFQYKAVFDSDTVNTPLLEQIVINYEK